jgi:hypothetical protein
MVSFAELWEQIEKNKGASPLMTSGEDGRALNVVRLGKDMRDEDQGSFWDDFISLCGNSDGLSELFGVSREKIASWPAKIQEMLDKLEQHNAESPTEREDKEVVATGDTGAFTTNQDPTNLGGM